MNMDKNPFSILKIITIFVKMETNMHRYLLKWLRYESNKNNFIFNMYEYR